MLREELPLLARLRFAPLLLPMNTSLVGLEQKEGTLSYPTVVSEFLWVNLRYFGAIDLGHISQFSAALLRFCRQKNTRCRNILKKPRVNDGRMVIAKLPTCL